MAETSSSPAAPKDISAENTAAKSAGAKARARKSAKTAKEAGAKDINAKAAAQPWDAPLFTPESAAPDERQAVAAADKAHALLQAARANLARVIFGQEEAVEQTLTALLAGGHALLVGVPGLAKTRLVESLGAILGLEEKRIQFTPDLMPADILGSEVLEEDAKGRRAFRYIQGPVFAQLLMADEINRASPRTQAALLQAMQEYYITIAGRRYDLPQPFHVLATQNPIEQEGTYPLPEAQLDRFLMQINLPYPDRATEKQIILATTGTKAQKPAQALNAARLLEMQALVRALPMPENVLNAILDLVRACRPAETAAGNAADSAPANSGLRRYISWGPGPRAAQALSLCARARALLQGRLAPDSGDVKALALPVLAHRMALNFTAKAENITLPAIIARLAEGIA